MLKVLTTSTGMMIVCALACSFQTARAAEYLGNELDGDSFNCVAFSYSTSNYYNLVCEFDGDDVILYFPNGGHIRVTMDSDEIDDPSSISAYDYDRGVYWDLDVDI